MKRLNGKDYVEVKDKRYIIHPTENNILRERKKPRSLRTQYQIFNKTQIRRNQKVLKNENNELELILFPKRERKRLLKNVN